MSSRTVLLVCTPIAALGLAVAVHGTLRVSQARRELAALAQTSAFEGRAFAETLQGAHAARQLEALDTRRKLARKLAAARRDRLLGVLLLLGAGVVGAGLRSLARMAEEIRDDHRHFADWGAPGPGEKVDWKGP